MLRSVGLGCLAYMSTVSRFFRFVPPIVLAEMGRKYDSSICSRNLVFVELCSAEQRCSALSRYSCLITINWLDILYVGSSLFLSLSLSLSLCNNNKGHSLRLRSSRKMINCAFAVDDEVNLSKQKGQRPARPFVSTYRIGRLGVSFFLHFIVLIFCHQL